MRFENLRYYEEHTKVVIVFLLRCESMFDVLHKIRIMSINNLVNFQLTSYLLANLHVVTCVYIIHRITFYHTYRTNIVDKMATGHTSVDSNSSADMANI